MGNFCCSEPIDYEDEIDLRHFELLRSVGKGAFGKVRIVQKKNDKKIYALKYINKIKCIKMKAVSNVIQERRLLEEVDFPLIVNLRYAFQDDDNMFMVIDLMLGGDLRFHIDRSGPMREEVVRFYVAEIASSINYLHRKRIVHRDLKPDNVLLDDSGHAHLTDFNIAVRYSEGTPLKSVAGSMAYMAPEVLSKKGYFSSPDWWSLGVIMYELLFGKRPFRGKSNDALTSAILHDLVTFPTYADNSTSKECQDLIRALLERDIDKRLGHKQNWTSFQNHTFFKMTINQQGPIVWDELATKRVKPPFTPDTKRANFDASHELEELLLEENPLRARKRAGKRDYSRFPGGENGDMAKELQAIDKKFTVFNYERKSTYDPHGSLTMIHAESSGADTSDPAESAEDQDTSSVSMHDLGNYISESPKRDSQDASDEATAKKSSPEPKSAL